MHNFPARSAGTLAALLLIVTIWTPAPAHADWTTYRGDAARSGVDSSSVGSLPFASAWTSQNLGGAIWAEPLVHDGLVIVATESDQVVALNESTGQVVWQASAGTPVPSNQLPCGDIAPTVGITSTPVIDPGTNRVFAVADDLNGSSIQHELYAFNLSDGSRVAGFPMSVEPPGDVPADQLQRSGLAVTDGQIIIGYGGNNGDCGSYHGWLVAAPEAAGPQPAFEVDPSGSDGAIWGSGNAPAIDSSGNIWVSTGNGGSNSSYGYQESVLRLNPSMNLLDSWAPSNWASLDSADDDLGSSEPLLLPGGLVFQIGKAGVGYLLSASHLGGEGGTPAYQAPVCGGSWGGAVYYNGIIYATCADGLTALALNASAPSFSRLGSWRVTSAINGPPIVAGGLVWATDWNHGTLYGLNLQTGEATVKQSTPSMEHFATPAASDGKLFLATGNTVEAYTIADPAPPSSGSPAGPTAARAKCVLKLRSTRVKVHHPKRRKHHKHALRAFATVALMARCDRAIQANISGIVKEHLAKRGKHGKVRSRTFHLAVVRLALQARVARTVQIRLPAALWRALARRIRESAAFTLTSETGGGTKRVVARARLRL